MDFAAANVATQRGLGLERVAGREQSPDANVGDSAPRLTIRSLVLKPVGANVGRSRCSSGARRAKVGKSQQRPGLSAMPPTLPAHGTGFETSSCQRWPLSMLVPGALRQRSGSPVNLNAMRQHCPPSALVLKPVRANIGHLGARALGPLGVGTHPGGECFT